MNTFRSALGQQEFVLTAEPILRPDTSTAELSRCATGLRGHVAAMQIGNDRFANAPISSMAAASIVLDAGSDVVLRLSCRDRNRLALQSELLGAAAIGVSSTLLERGHKLPDALKGKVKSVFDTSTAQLLSMAMLVGENIDELSMSGLTLGAAATIIEPTAGWQGDRLLEKTAAGATFLQTQPCLNVGLLEKYMAALVSLKLTHRASIIVEVPLLESVAQAKALKSADAGAPLPQALLNRIGPAKNAAAEGETICVETILKIRKIAGISGVNILFGGDVERVVSVLQRCKRPDC